MKTRRVFNILGVLLVCMLAASVSAAGNPVIHSVSAGGPDVCSAFEEFDLHPGCDGTFSLKAIMYADGTVKGQYVDKFGEGEGFPGGRIHAVINCLYVDGNEAWVSGVITQNSSPFTSYQTVAARVKDNGTTANDPPDQISFSWFIEGQPPFQCTDHPDVPLYIAPEGQVIVK